MDQSVEEKKIQPLTVLVVSLLVIIVLIFFISKDMDKVRAFIAQSGWIGLLVSVILYGILGASPVPSEPLTVLISTIFGPLNATLVAGFGNLLAGLVEYFIGGQIGMAASFTNRRHKLPFGLNRFPVNSAVFLIGARMLPGYGPKFVSVLAGVYKVPMWRFIWTTLVTTLAGAAIFAYGGFGLLHLLPR